MMFPPDFEHYGKGLVLVALTIAIVIYGARIIKAIYLATGG